MGALLTGTKVTILSRSPSNDTASFGGKGALLRYKTSSRCLACALISPFPALRQREPSVVSWKKTISDATLIYVMGRKSSLVKAFARELRAQSCAR